MSNKVSNNTVYNVSLSQLYIKTTTVDTIIGTTPGGETDINSNGTGSNFDYEAPVFDDTETVENTTAILFVDGDVDTTTITTTTTTTTTTTEKPVASTKERSKYKLEYQF